MTIQRVLKLATLLHFTAHYCWRFVKLYCKRRKEFPILCLHDLYKIYQVEAGCLSFRCFCVWSVPYEYVILQMHAFISLMHIKPTFISNMNNFRYPCIKTEDTFWPCQFQVGTEDVWCNPVPNSVLYSRPLCIVRVRESRETILGSTFQTHLDALHSMKISGLDIELNGKLHKLWVRICEHVFSEL